MPWNKPTPSRVTGCKGQYKTWTLDCELDHGLDCGLDHGLDTDNAVVIWTRSWMASGQRLCVNYPGQSFDVL